VCGQLALGGPAQVFTHAAQQGLPKAGRGPRPNQLPIEGKRWATQQFAGSTRLLTSRGPGARADPGRLTAAGYHLDGLASLLRQGSKKETMAEATPRMRHVEQQRLHFDAVMLGWIQAGGFRIRGSAGGSEPAAG